MLNIQITEPSGKIHELLYPKKHARILFTLITVYQIWDASKKETFGACSGRWHYDFIRRRKTSVFNMPQKHETFNNDRYKIFNNSRNYRNRIRSSRLGFDLPTNVMLCCCAHLGID